MGPLSPISVTPWISGPNVDKYFHVWTRDPGQVDSQPDLDLGVPSPPSPFQTPELGVSFLEVGQDAYLKKEVYLWKVLVPGDGDWELDDAGSSAVGVMPDWFYDCDIDLAWELTGSVGGRSQVMNWAMREGVMPGQRFLVYVSTPVWSRCNSEYDECDWAADVRVLAKENRCCSLRTLEQMVGDVVSFAPAMEQHFRYQQEARWAKTDRLSIRYSSGWGQEKPWHRAELVSSLDDRDRPEQHGYHVLAHGRSDGEGATRNGALEDLAKHVAESHPKLDLTVLRGGSKHG